MNIRVNMTTSIKDGTEVVFRSPVDCSQVTGLVVYYDGGSKEFAFADAHGNNVGDIDHLFAEDVVVKVILDVTKGMAFVQNADTNAYLEAQLASKAPAGYGFGENLLSRSGNMLAAWEDSYEAYCSKVDAELAKMEDYTAKLVLARGVIGNGDMYQAAENSVAILYRGNSAEYAHLTTLSHGSVTPGALWRMQKTNGVWSEPEWVNPPLVTNVVYRTTERYLGAAVYKKVDENGNVLWRKEGETSWRTSGSGGSGGGASGEDGITPHIGDNGNWWIGTEDTGVSAYGTRQFTGELTDGAYIHNSKGSVTANSAYSYMDYWNVKGFLYLELHTQTSATGIAVAMAFYDAGKNFVSSYRPDNGFVITEPVDVPIPAGAVYARVSCRTENKADFKAIAKNACNPVKGVDYFTEEDKTEIVNEVLAALPKYNGTVEVV